MMGCKGKSVLSSYINMIEAVPIICMLYWKEFQERCCLTGSIQEIIHAVSIFGG